MPDALRVYESRNEIPTTERRENRDFNSCNDSSTYKTSVCQVCQVGWKTSDRHKAEHKVPRVRRP